MWSFRVYGLAPMGAGFIFYGFSPTTMQLLLIDFGQNLTLLLAMVFVYGLMLRLCPRQQGTAWQIWLGVFFAVSGMLCMFMPLQFADGVNVDLRIAAVALAALFGGPVAAAIAVLGTSSLRFLQGGVGAIPGVMAISSAAVCGLLIHYLWLKGRKTVSHRMLFIVGVMVVPGTLPWVFLLPASIDHMELLSRMVLPIAIMYPLGTWAMGAALRSAEAANKMVQRVEDSERRFRSLFDCAPDLILVADPVTRCIVAANPKAVAALKRSESELVGMPVLDLHPPERAEYHATLFDRFLQDSRSGMPSTPTDAVFLLPSGEHLPVDAVAQTVRIEGEEHLVGFFRDQSDRKRAEDERDAAQALTTDILDTANALVVGLDENKRIRLVNQACCDLTGYDRAEMIGADWFALFIPDGNAEEMDQVWQQLMQTGQPDAYENAIRTKAGNDCWVQWRNVVVQRQDGIRTLSVGIDVTEQRQVNEQLRQADKMQAVGQLAGGIAHDFNNQLQIISSHTALLQKRATGEGVEELLSVIGRTVDRSADLVRKLLAFSRQDPLQLVAIDLHQLINDVVGMAERGIDKRIVIAKQLLNGPALVSGDPAGLQNALLNLLLNARDAIPDGGEITITTSRQEMAAGSGLPAGQYWRVSVADNGIGMSEEVRERIFEPFFTTKPQGKGTGLGLAAVFGTVRAHGGDVEVKTSIGNGTAFSLLLPIAGDLVDAATQNEAGENLQQQGNEETHVLIVDDEPFIVQIWQTSLAELGYRVTTFTAGAAALDWAKSNIDSVSIALIDYNMPEISGADVIRGLHRMKNTLPVIIGTGFGSEVISQQLLADDRVEILCKPFGITELIQAIQDKVVACHR